MKKVLILLVIAALLIFFGPKLMNGLLEMFSGKQFALTGTWQIEYTIYDKVTYETIEFSKADGAGKGMVTCDGATAGSYELKDKAVIFTLKFADISRDKLDAEFRGTAESNKQIDIGDSMRGALEGTRMVNGITVETEGEWNGSRIE